MEKKIKHAARVVRKGADRATESRKVRFGLVGVVNTAVDFIVLNLLVGLFGVPIFMANILSTTVAMLTSFTLNKRAVFRGGEGSALRQFVMFLVVTLAAIWLVQSGVMYIVYTWLHSTTDWNEAVLLNIAKLCGISAGFVWNYIGYSRVVFPGKKTAER